MKKYVFIVMIFSCGSLLSSNAINLAENYAEIPEFIENKNLSERELDTLFNVLWFFFDTQSHRQLPMSQECARDLLLEMNKVHGYEPLFLERFQEVGMFRAFLQEWTPHQDNSDLSESDRELSENSEDDYSKGNLVTAAEYKKIMHIEDLFKLLESGEICSETRAAIAGSLQMAIEGLKSIECANSFRSRFAQLKKVTI